MTSIEAYDRAWRHFEMIASQRLTTFNFYLVILAAFIATFMTMLEKQTSIHVWYILAACNMGVPILFFMIDQRGKGLLELLKKTLIHVESTEDWPSYYKHFHDDAESQKKFPNSVFSYTGAFRIAFFAHFLFGLFLLVGPVSPTTIPNRESPISAQPTSTP